MPPTTRTSSYLQMRRLSSLLLLLGALPTITDAFATSHQWRSAAVPQHHDRIPRYSTSRRRRHDLSMHMGHSHSHSHSHSHAIPTSNTLSPQQLQQSHRRRLQLSCLASFIAVLLAMPWVQHWRSAALMGATSGVGAYTTVQPVWLRIRAWMKGITRHRPRYAPRTNAADRVTVLGGIVNLFLSAGKLGVGVACHSSALIADAGHSLSDLFSDVVTLWAVSVGRLPPDEDHPYGHGKFEAVGSLFLSLTLLGTGLGIGLLSNRKLLEILRLQRQGVAAAATPLPGIAALAMAGISVLVKEWLFRITRRVGERLHSNVVIANAWHHRSDAYSSILALASIALARYVPGLVCVDAAAGLLVGATIGMTGAEILGDSINALTDRHPEAVGHAVTAAAQEHPAVKAVTHIKARPVGSVVNVDVDVDVVRRSEATTNGQNDTKNHVEEDDENDSTAKEIQQHIEQTCSAGDTSGEQPAVHVRVHTHTVDEHDAAVRALVQHAIPDGITIASIQRTNKKALEIVLAAASASSMERLQAVAPQLQEDLLQSMEGRVETVHLYLDLLHPALTPAVAPRQP